MMRPAGNHRLHGKSPRRRKIGRNEQLARRPVAGIDADSRDVFLTRLIVGAVNIVLTGDGNRVGDDRRRSDEKKAYKESRNANKRVFHRTPSLSLLRAANSARRASLRSFAYCRRA
jgi:hypothetical protein